MRSPWITTALAAVALALVSCATAPPQELREARTVHRDAINSQAAIEAPDELAEASEALREAEHAFDEHGDDEITREKAWIAKVKAERAMDKADQRIAIRNEQAKEIEQPAQAPGADRPRVQAEIEPDLLATLREHATVEQGEGGVLLSLAADVTFDSGSAVLAASAKRKLELIAGALATYPEMPIEVSGHADSVGGEAFNLQLSLDRARAVRDVLIGAGLDESRLTVVGRGTEAPVAANDTADGRKQNRRVEIRLGHTM
jgi:outer membrane protein OmpA-like peptidoglycan-associated protein